MGRRTWGPTRQGSLGVLIGGVVTLVGGGVVVFVGLVDQGQTLLGVGVGIMAVGVAGTLWSARREARADEPGSSRGPSGSTDPLAG